MESVSRRRINAALELLKEAKELLSRAEAAGPQGRYALGEDVGIINRQVTALEARLLYARSELDRDATSMPDGCRQAETAPSRAA